MLASLGQLARNAEIVRVMVTTELMNRFETVILTSIILSSYKILSVRGSLEIRLPFFSNC